MTTDFKATQVQTNKIIVTGSFAGDGSNQLIIYNYAADDSGSPNQGVIDPTKFDTTSGIGSDVFLFVSGGVATRGTGGSYGVTVTGGDLHVSGNLTVGGTYPSGGGGGGGDVYWTSTAAGVIQTTGSIVISGASNTISGLWTTVLGSGNTGTGTSIFVHGAGNTANATAAHAEGGNTVSSGLNSHSEGESTRASGQGSHSEGYLTTGSGQYSHAEGYETLSAGLGSHSEGALTTGSGPGSHAEGGFTQAHGTLSHTEGTFTQAGRLGLAITAGTADTVDPNNWVFELDIAYGNITGAPPYFPGSTIITDDGTFPPPSALYRYDIVSLNYDSIAGRTYITASDSYGMGTYHTGGSLTGLDFDTGLSIEDVTMAGYAAHAEGSRNQLSQQIAGYALGSYSHSEGYETIAFNNYSHSEGEGTRAYGVGSHAEGSYTVSSGSYSHAEGESTTASGDRSHAEGNATTASGPGSHAEGFGTIASGISSHAEGDSTTASGFRSHAEGQTTIASGFASHAEGNASTSSGQYSHSEGYTTIASGNYSHAEGFETLSLGESSHAEGYFATGSGDFSHAEGDHTAALGIAAHAEGANTQAVGNSSHAEGDGSISSGSWSHAEGYYTLALGNNSHAEGAFTTGSGNVSHAEGVLTKAIGDASHAEGFFTVSIGDASHAEGSGSIAFASASHAEGIYTIASGSGQLAAGKYNLRNNDFSLFVIGDGTADDDASRSDIVRVNSGTLPGSGSFEVTGTVRSTLGFSGSLTQLTDGRSYLVAGTNVTITSASDGQVTINSTGGGGGGSQYWDSLQVGAVYTSGSTLFRGPAGSNTSPDDFGTDTFFYVSGSIGSKDTAVTGTAVFGGDVVISGTLHGGSPLKIGSGLQVTGTLDIKDGLSGSLTRLSNGSSYLVAGTNVTIASESNGQVTISSTGGGGGGDQFWQSNTLNSIFTTGSVLITGSLHTSSSITGSNLVLEAPASRILAPNGALVISSSTGTFLTGTFIVSGTRSNLGTEQSSILFNGDLFVSGGIGVNDYLQLKPVNTLLIPTNTTASYIYVSGSTNDLYFTQYNDPYTNTTRLRWLESTLSTGLLHGGILSTQNGTTTFSMTSGSGLVVSYNASTTTDPYPTIKFVGWSAYVSQSLTYSGSAQISYIGINDSGGIIQRTTPFDAIDYETYIPIGRILHQSGSVTNGTITSPHVSYGVPGSHDVFVRAFGPLKLSGHILAASGSTLSLTKTGGDSYVEGRNYTSNPSSPDLVLSTTDFALTGSKIYREHVSGSNPVIDTGVGAAGYTDIDPTKYVDANGNLQTVSGGQYTVQRVFWFPNSVNRALFVYYGPTSYNSIASAQSGIADEVFIEGANTAGAAIFVGYVIVRSNASDLTDTAQAKIIQGPLFRAAGSGGGGGGGGTTTAGGSDTYVQFNDGGSTFGGVAGLTFNKVTNTLTTTNLAVSNIATVSGSVILGDSPSDVVTVSGSLRALSGIQVTGSIAATLGFSGSLTHLTDGTSYLIAGTNVQISTGSTGAVTISSIPNNVVRDRTTATNFTIDTATDQFIRVSSAATGTLPNPSTSGSFVLKKTGTGTYTINISGSYGELIDGQTYDTSGFTLTGSNATDRPAWTIWSDGTDWWIA